MLQNIFKSEKNPSNNLSMDTKKQSGDSKGLLAGYCTETGNEVYLDYDHLIMHASICGSLGSGTSILRNSFMKQQMSNGGGLLFIDGGLSDTELETVYRNACSTGRKSDFMLIDPTDPENPNTYNPIIFGDSQEISSRIINTVFNMDGKADSNYFQSSAVGTLEIIISAFKCLGKAYNLDDLASVLINEQALMEVKRRLLENHEDSQETQLFLTLLSRYTTNNGFDMEKFKLTLGGLEKRICELSKSAFGNVINTYNPEVNLEECILQNKIIYVKLPTSNDNHDAVTLAKLIVGECRSAIAKLQRLPVEALPNPPFMFWPNECSSYIDFSWCRMFEQGRLSRFIMIPTFQTIKSLEHDGDTGLSDIVLGNTYYKFYFKQLNTEAAIQVANEIGMKSGSGSEETYVVSPEQIKSIPLGECLLVVGMEQIYRLRLPLTDPAAQSE